MTSSSGYATGLLDPDDNEIEVYYELPRSQWEPHPEKGLFGGEFQRRLEEPRPPVTTACHFERSREI